MRIPVLVLILFTVVRLQAQTCNTPGQTPSTAFPVCGSTVFKQSTVPLCETGSIPVPGCEGDGLNYTDINPFWYRIHCFVSGTLGFEIRPSDMTDDYDWQLFDITGRDPNDVFKDKSLVVTANWSGEKGLTGASTSGSSSLVCGTTTGAPFRPLFTAMPNLVAGRDYLLLVSHFTPSQSGYELEFKGGTAVITDPNPPKPVKAWAGCGATSITVQLDKKLLCSSIAANGSDFTITPMPAGVNILSASSSRCNSGFDMDTVMITLSAPLPSGNYALNIVRGTDNNTLWDECQKEVPPGSNVPFTIQPFPYTPMDSIKPVSCAPQTLELVFQKPILCNSIAANGSDFRLTGPVPVNILRASGNCVNGKTTIIKVELASPIQTGGNYELLLARGTDGNTILDECSFETPAGMRVSFTTKDTVNADFNYTIRWGCKADSVDFTWLSRNGVNTWRWTFDNIGFSSQQNPGFIFREFGPKKVSLIVSNGFCAAMKDTIIDLDNELDARFSMPDVLCPEDQAEFKDQSIGKILSWDWDFDNGFRSNAPNPLPQRYPKVTIGRAKFHIVQLIVKNNLGCADTLAKKLQVVNSCYIAVPNAFTPNNDFNNDYLYPLNAWKATDLEFAVYNRYGQLIFHTSDWTKKWDGTFKGVPQPTGTYVWILKYTDRETGQKFVKKGASLLIR